jgi:hypothetical protein
VDAFKEADAHGRAVTDPAIRPLFLACDRTQALTCWIGIVGNALLIVGGAAWLVDHRAAATISVLPTLLLALFLADLFSGFVHWLSDTWFDEAFSERIVSIAREHHLFPQHIIGYGFRDYVAFSSWPTVVTWGPIGLMLVLLPDATPIVFDGVVVCVIVSTIMFFGTHAHRLGHKRADGPIGRFLQDTHLLMSPRHHGVHHGGNHDIRYCVVNGWANHVCDRIGFWRVLERLVTCATGAVARRNDHEWFARFNQDPTFLAAARRSIGVRQLSRPAPASARSVDAPSAAD